MEAQTPASLPQGEPASGKMSLKDAVRAGVNSLPKFNGNGADSAATDDLAAVETESPAPKATETETPGSEAPETPDAGPEAESKPRPVEGQPDEQASQDSLAAPARWPEDRRKAFEALPEEAKRILLEREKEFNTGLTQNAQKSAESVRRLESINGLFQDHHRKQMEAAGYDEVQTVKELLARHDAFNRDPVGYGLVVAKHFGDGNPKAYVAELIKQSGLKQEDLFGGATPAAQTQETPAQDEWVDPEILALKQRLEKAEQSLQQQETDKQTQAQRAFNDAVFAFENAKNEDGSPKYPHLSSVTQDIVRLVKGDPELMQNPQKVLEAAYAEAIYLNPEVRKTLLEEEFAKRLSAKESKEAAERAKRASAAKPSPGASSGQARPSRMSIKEAVRQAALKHVKP